jgi:hypothetical protein
MTLRGGKGGLLQNAADLCAKPRLAIARFVGQANRGVAWHPRVKSKCGQRGSRQKRHHNQRRKGTRR